MQFKVLSVLALLAVLAAASPVPQPQVKEGGATAGGVETTVGTTLGKVGAATLPDSVVVSGTKGAGGEPGPEQDNVSDGAAGVVGSTVDALAPALADGAVKGAGGTPGAD